jgi:hypothetical protein
LAPLRTAFRSIVKSAVRRSGVTACTVRLQVPAFRGGSARTVMRLGGNLCDTPRSPPQPVRQASRTRVRNQRRTTTGVTGFCDRHRHGHLLRPGLHRRPAATPAGRRARARRYQVFTETASAAAADRPVLEQVLDQLRPGDTFVVRKLNRPGESGRQNRRPNPIFASAAVSWAVSPAVSRRQDRPDGGVLREPMTACWSRSPATSVVPRAAARLPPPAARVSAWPQPGTRSPCTACAAPGPVASARSA